MNNKYAIGSGLSLLIFTLLCISLVYSFQDNTKDKIQRNIDRVKLDKLGELVSNYDNDILAQKYHKLFFIYGATQTLSIYPAKINQSIVAYLIEHVYPKGYSGSIVLLSAIDPAGKLIGMRVITHQETPGLGDRIDLAKSDWITQFNDMLFTNTLWRLKEQGGQFDALTGATISSHALIRASYELLDHWQSIVSQ